MSKLISHPEPTYIYFFFVNAQEEEYHVLTVHLIGVASRTNIATLAQGESQVKDKSLAKQSSNDDAI